MKNEDSMTLTECMEAVGPLEFRVNTERERIRARDGDAPLPPLRQFECSREGVEKYMAKLNQFLESLKAPPQKTASLAQPATASAASSVTQSGQSTSSPSIKPDAAPPSSQSGRFTGATALAMAAPKSDKLKQTGLAK